MTDVVLPALGEGIEKATVSAWFVKPGDQVSKDDDVVELVTDKASFNVSAPVAGRIGKILVEAGAEAAIGQSLATIE